MRGGHPPAIPVVFSLSVVQSRLVDLGWEPLRLRQALSVEALGEGVRVFRLGDQDVLRWFILIVALLLDPARCCYCWPRRRLGGNSNPALCWLLRGAGFLLSVKLAAASWQMA